MLHEKPMRSIKPQLDKPKLLRYANSVLLTIIALGMSLAFLQFLSQTPFLFFFAAVALSAWYGGLGPGLLATVLTVIFVEFFILEPLYVFSTQTVDLITFSVFAFVAFLISWTESHRLESEAALREAHDELRIILDSVQDAITVQDANGRIVYANQTAPQVAGYPSNQALVGLTADQLRQGKQIFDVDGNPLPFTSLPRYRVFETGQPASLVFRRHLTKTQEDQWLSLAASPIFDDYGNVRLAVNILRDITEQYEAEQQRAILANIVKYSYDAIFSKTREGILQSWNPGAEALYGYTVEEAIGRHVSLIWPPDLKESEMNIMDRLNAGELIQYYETTRCRKDGQRIDVMVTISPLQGLQGQNIGYSVVARDITLRRKLEKLREENERFLRQILNTMPILVSVLTPDGIVTEANRNALAIANLSPEDVLGKHIEDTYWLSHSTEVQQQLHQSIKRARQGETVQQELTMRTASDDWAIVDLTVTPMRDEYGVISHLVPTAVDITERKQREDYIMTLSQRIQTQTNRLNNILANVPGIVFEAGPSLVDDGIEITFISNYVETMTGYSATEWKTNPRFFRHITHPDDVEKIIRDQNRLFTSGEHSVLPFRIIRKDETIIHAEAHASVVFDQDEIPLSICGVIMDVTEQKLARDQLLQLTLLSEAQHQQLSNIVANVPGIVYDMSINKKTGRQKVNFISSYVEQMLGYAPRNWDEDPGFWRTIIHPDDAGVAAQAATAAQETGEPGIVEFRCIRADGTIINTEAFFAFANEGDIVKGYGVVMDITKRKQVETALAQYMRDLKRSNQELEQFAYVASHDLQEPLRKVTSYLQLIENRYSDKLDQDAKEFIEFAVDGASRMKNLINDLLTFSRVQRNREDFDRINIQVALDRVMNNLQLMIEDTNAQITHDPMPEIMANERQLVQLFQNLISNAIKFQRDEPPCIHISVEKKTETEEWLFSVRDNGIGIESEYLDRIFIIFQRLHGQGKYPGTGIGLAICKKVVENHRGRIWVTSKPGQGTTFYFTMPMLDERMQDHELLSRSG